jgi:predicted transcriptional regulator
MVTSSQLYQIRLRLGETQEAFAKRFGVHQSTYQRWEARGVPRYGAARSAIESVLEAMKPKRARSEALVEQADTSPVKEWKF